MPATTSSGGWIDASEFRPFPWSKTKDAADNVWLRHSATLPAFMMWRQYFSVMDIIANVSEARLFSVLDTAVDGIVVIDADGAILMYNAACERLFGYTAAEAYGKNVKMLMPPQYADHHDTYISNFHRTGVRKIIGIGREVLGQHKDGSIFPIELSVGETETSTGRQFIGIMRDLRPRYANQRRLDDLQTQLVQMARLSALDEMGATLAHELNQPLTAILLYLQVVERKLEALEAGDSSAQIVHKARHEAERASAIIRRLRQFVERGETTRSVQDLTTIVEDAVELASIGAKNKGVIVVNEMEDDPSLLIHADAVQIQQIVVNLVRNAIDATCTAEGKEVHVRAWRENGDAYVRTIDDGTGIDPMVKDTLFKAFQTTKKDGLGIGLAISQSIAQSHSGEIIAKNRKGRTGAEFTLRLPVAKPEIA